MEVSGKKIIIWCGAAPNQKALAVKISKEFPVVAIVIDEKPGGKSKRRLSDYPSLILDRLRFRKIYNAWKGLMQFYTNRFTEWPDVPVLRVAGINQPDVISFSEKFKPDLIVVSGTALIKSPVLKTESSIGMINLHTGLSPYVKGGPNCTNWCIANNDWHLVGNTIMWLNAGIDAGNIIASETTDIRHANTIGEAHIRVMDHAHDLYLRCIRYLLSASPPFQSIPQNTIAKGSLYLTKMWNREKRNLLLRNWKNRHAVNTKEKPVTISLPDYNSSLKHE